jgi:hypothetical protein
MHDLSHEIYESEQIDRAEQEKDALGKQCFRCGTRPRERERERK